MALVGVRRLTGVRVTAVPEGGPGGEPVPVSPVPVDQVAPCLLQVAERCLTVVSEPGTKRILLTTENHSQSVWRGRILPSEALVGRVPVQSDSSSTETDREVPTQYVGPVQDTARPCLDWRSPRWPHSGGGGTEALTTPAIPEPGQNSTELNSFASQDERSGLRG